MGGDQVVRAEPREWTSALRKGAPEPPSPRPPGEVTVEGGNSLPGRTLTRRGVSWCLGLDLPGLHIMTINILI